MILVTGATGTIGGEALRLLTGRGAKVRAMIRDPRRLEGFDLKGFDLLRGDFDDPVSLRAAVTGVESVFLLTAPGSWVPRHDLAMIDAARTAGVREVVKLSAVGGGLGLPSDWHAPGEQALAESGLDWTVLRASSFASNALRWAPVIRAGESVPNVTGIGAQGVVDPRDVAEVAVEALLGDDHHGAAYTLTGPETISVPEQVAQLADLLGHPIDTVDIPLEAVREQTLAAGFDASVAEVAVRGAQLVRDGGNAVVTDDVRRVLGRPARSFRTWARDHLDAFAG